jgi:UDP-glucose 4-epimerase
MKTGEGMRRVVVTGGGGFIGTHVTNRLRQHGVKVIALDQSGESPDVVRTDIRDRAALERILQAGDALIHLANTSNPTTSELDRVRDVEENLAGTLQVLDACVQTGVACFVLASSGGTVYGIPEVIPIPETHSTNPISSHGALKLAIEKYVQVYGAQFGLRHVILRCANAYGPGQTGSQGQGIIGRAIVTALRDETLEIWGDGTVVRDFVYVEDVAAALLLATTNADATGVINIGSGRGTSVNEIIDLIRRVTGRPLRVRYTPSRQFDAPANVLDITKAGTMLQWKPTTPLEEGIQRCYAWACGRTSEAVK